MYKTFFRALNIVSMLLMSLTQEVLLGAVHLPLKKPPANKKEQNKERNLKLSNRRRSTWSPEELETRETVKSRMEDVKKMYCDIAGLNPFRFPTAAMSLNEDATSDSNILILENIQPSALL